MYFCYSTILEYFEVNYNLNFVLPCHVLILIKAEVIVILHSGYCAQYSLINSPDIDMMIFYMSLIIP